jgi:hypothetical protein
MKSVASMLVILAFAAFFSSADASQMSPIEKIIDMISDLQAKVISEGTDAQKNI